jgi:all-trans-retinol 13,14-reductase
MPQDTEKRVKKNFDVIIIGSGLGGLECGYILTKKGLNVCILEQNPQIGGCLQTFKRGKTTFDTGFHYVGGLEEGQSLHKLFSYFDLLDLPWQKLDEACFDEIILNGKSYSFATGHDRFVETLAAGFPDQHENLKKYASFLKQVGDDLYRSFEKKNEEEFYSTSVFSKPAFDFLNETITDPVLRNVLSGASLKMELNPHKLPLYIFAQINNSFIQSAWRLNGGGSLIADALAKKIRAMGGTILTKANVTRLIEENGKIASVEINNDEQISAAHFISNIHPARTLDLIAESKQIRKIYRKRISGLPNTYGMFTVNIELKEETVPYLNRNQYMYNTDDVWSYYRYEAGRKTSCALVSYQVPEAEKIHTRNLDILTPMHWEEVEKWQDTCIGKRGGDYEELKRERAAECIELASRHIPGLKDGIQKIYTSTPLSYRDYTATANGSAYGIQKDYSALMYTILTPRTPVPNLFLTGQNLNLHGVLGVSMTSVFTCAEIVGMETLVDDLS